MPAIQSRLIQSQRFSEFNVSQQQRVQSLQQVKNTFRKEYFAKSTYFRKKKWKKMQDL